MVHRNYYGRGARSDRLLEEEVEQLAKRRASSEIDPQALMTIAIVPLSVDDLSDQLAEARSQGRRLPHMK